MSQENQIPNRRAFDNWKVVGPFARTLSFIIDGAIAAILVAFGTYLLKKPFLFSHFAYLWLLTLWAWEGFWLTLTGTTPGRRPFGISVYSPRTDGVPHPIQVCLRILTFWISALLLGAGLTPILFRRDRRGWHDLISETLTVGKERDLPSAFAQKFGQSLLLFQSLTVFSTFGALLLSTGTGHMEALKQERVALSCDNQDLLLKKTPEVLLALTISPAWHECLPRLISAMGPISDSQLARLAIIASKYFELWTHSEAFRSQYYALEIQGREDELCNGSHSFEDVCKTARSLASVTVGTETEHLSWLSQYEDFARDISREAQPQRRIEYLNEALLKFTDPIVTGAIRDRIWSEELAQGLYPSAALESTSNSQWVYKQACWVKALGFDSQYTCNSNDLTEAVAALESLHKGVSTSEVQDKLSRLELGEYKSDFAIIINNWQPKSLEASQGSNSPLGQISYVSPLRSIASKIQE